MKSIRTATHLKGKIVLIRSALNVPVENGKVTGSFRLQKALKTILFLQKKGAKVVLLGHIGDKGDESLRPVFDVLTKAIPHLSFSNVTVGPEARTSIHTMNNGDVLMLENVRRMKGEKENDHHLSEELAALADIFVQDSFDVCHRVHASVVGVAELLPSYAGFLVEEEVAGLKQALKPKSPALAVIAGSKFSTKEPVLHVLLQGYEKVFVGGALANDLLETEGFFIGDSLVSGGDHVAMKEVTEHKNLLLPTDALVAPLTASRVEAEQALVARIPEHAAILDIGPETMALLAPHIKKAKTIVWNGTLGKYESGFMDGTREVAKAILASKAHSIVGGGDTVAALDMLGLTSKFDFVSTGGGAMLDYLAYGTLPGLDVLK
jgi:phosphoglycerate kinase